jgi:DNA-binding IclR family transcriptional regulator
MHSLPPAAAPSTPLLFALLDALYTLSPTQARLDAASLARRLGVSVTDAARALVRLEQLGLADAARVRLTMRGLAVAAAHDAQVARESVRRVA